MKVFFCDLVHNQVAGDNQISESADFVVPFGVASIASHLKDNFEGPLTISIFKYAEELLAAVEADAPDVIGYSNYYWSSDLNYKIGSEIKNRHPEILTVMGGPSIRTALDGIAQFLRDNTYVDVYVMFEGERPFLELLQVFATDGKNFMNGDQGLASCAYLVGDNLVYTSSAQNGSISEFSSPYLNGMLDEFLEDGLIPLLETNRGCPFQCTFCTWGISALTKVRQYSLDRVYAEFDYVSSKFPALPGWILADANFGIFKRDVEIAKKISDIKSQTPGLRHVLLWESKNTSERNFEIAQMMGSDASDTVNDVLMAVQTLDPVTQENTKRDNIGLDHVPDKIERFHDLGASVLTHVLSGLPGETYQAHLDTLRKCFDLGFDHVHVFSTLLLPGSEMETDESREKFGLKTKYRLRQGAYGEYHSIKSIDAEEIIRETAAIGEKEMLSLRPVHWLIWYGWNHGFLKPMLQYAQKEHGINPVDLILEIFERCNDGSHPGLASLASQFIADAESEWFEDYDSLFNFYSKQGAWDNLIDNGFTKVEFKYNALMILNRDWYSEMLELTAEIVKRQVPYSQIDRLIGPLQEMMIHPESIFGRELPAEKKIPVSFDLQPYLIGASDSHENSESDQELTLVKPETDQAKAREQLLRYGYPENSSYAVEKTLGAVPDAFSYKPTQIRTANTLQ